MDAASPMSFEAVPARGKDDAMKKTAAAAAMVAAMLVAGLGHAAEHQIRMVGEGPDGDMAFEPAFVHAAPGDTIRFVPVDGYHNAETIRSMFPDGAEGFKGGIGEDFTVTLGEAGVYPVMCKSHYALGMVALVVVGDIPDAQTLARAVAGPHPLKAKAAFARILETIPHE